MMEKRQCPACAAAGRDTKGDNLVIFDDGHGYCFSCGHVEPADGDTSKSTKKGTSKGFNPSSELTLALAYPGKSYLDRMLKPFGVLSKPLLTRLGNATGKTMPKLWFPYFDTSSKGSVLSGLKYRDFSKETDGAKVTGWEAGSKFSLYGTHLLKQGGKGGTLIIVEGEPDTMLIRYLLTKANDQTTDVVGLPGSTLTSRVKDSMALLSRYDTIIIALDSDEAGEIARNKLLTILPGKLKVCTWSEKDPCDVLEAHGLKAVLRDLKRSQEVVSKSLLTGSALSTSYMDYLTSNESGGMVSSFTTLDSMLGSGIKPGEVLMLAAHTGRGKSTFVLNWVDSIVKKNGTQVLWYGTEMLPEQMTQKVIELRTGKELSFRKGKLNLPYEELEKHLIDVSSSYVFYNDVREIDTFTKAAIEAIYSGVRVIVVDVINDMSESISDWQQARTIMEKLSGLALGSPENKRPPVALILVGHTRQNDSGKYSNNVSLSDIKGGSTLITQCTCIVGMDSPPDDVKEGRGSGFIVNQTRRLVLLKRPRLGHSKADVCFVSYSEDTLRYQEIE